MKNAVLEKIHKFGRIGLIISRILLGISWGVLIVSFLFVIVLSFLPRGICSERTYGRKVVEMNLSHFEGELRIDQQKKEELVKDRGLDFPYFFGNDSYRLIDIREKDNVFQIIGESDSGMDYQDLSIVFFCLDVGLVLEIVILYYFKKFCSLFSVCETPFTEEVIETMRKLSVALIPLAVYYVIEDSVLQTILKGRLILSDQIDLTAVACILLIFLLISIFRYGAMLQKESDETL